MQRTGPVRRCARHDKCCKWGGWAYMRAAWSESNGMASSFPVLARCSSEPQGQTVPWSGTQSPALDDLSLQFVIYAGQSGERCLDVGCGSGLVAAATLARGGRVAAVDPDPQLIQQVL